MVNVPPKPVQKHVSQQLLVYAGGVLSFTLSPVAKTDSLGQESLFH